ncbi:MAG: PEP-CTERM sorting domain-containing protein [Sedimentisphaerales bacterium]|nr:PEP-CTERM sorting domain-containing protein [Sedimentisphaerales bacterium]
MPLLLQQTPAQGGVVSPSIGVHRYASDAEVTLIAVPKPGYKFVYWLGDVLDPTSNKTTAVLSKPKIIVAVFEQVDSGQLIVGQNTPTGGGGGGDFTGSAGSFSAAAPRSSGGSPGTPTSKPKPPTEGDDPDPLPPDDPPNPPDDPLDPPDDPFDPPDDPLDPPDVPEPATGLLLTLGGLALLRKRGAK